MRSKKQKIEEKIIKCRQILSFLPDYLSERVEKRRLFALFQENAFVLSILGSGAYPANEGYT